MVTVLPRDVLHESPAISRIVVLSPSRLIVLLHEEQPLVDCHKLLCCWIIFESPAARTAEKNSSKWSWLSLYTLRHTLLVLRVMQRDLEK
jgi:hypothetical protein